MGLALRCAILLGGQRFRQLLRLIRADDDNKAKVLRLTDAKGKRSTALPHYLPVSECAGDLLADLWAFNYAGPESYEPTTERSHRIDPYPLPTPTRYCVSHLTRSTRQMVRATRSPWAVRRRTVAVDER